MQYFAVQTQNWAVLVRGVVCCRWCAEKERAGCLVSRAERCSEGLCSSVIFLSAGGVFTAITHRKKAFAFVALQQKDGNFLRDAPVYIIRSYTGYLDIYIYIHISRPSAVEIESLEATDGT